MIAEVAFNRIISMYIEKKYVTQKKEEEQIKNPKTSGHFVHAATQIFDML